MTFGDSLCQKSNLTNLIDLLPSFRLGEQNLIHDLIKESITADSTTLSMACPLLATIL